RCTSFARRAGRGSCVIATGNTWRGLAVASLLAALSAATHAELRSIDLFSGEVLASTRSNDERRQLAGKALENAYIRITGDADVLAKYPSLRATLDRAHTYIASYQYHELENSLDNSDDDQPALRLTLAFDQAALRRAISAAGAPYWQAERPLLRLWLVEQRGSQRHFVTAASSPALYQALQQRAALRGLPLELPASARGGASLTLRDAWALSNTTLVNTAQRNAAEQVLLGKVARRPGVGWLGEWKVYDNGSIETRRIDSRNAAGVARVAIDTIAGRLASRFSVGSGNELAGNVFELSIDNLRERSDYLRMIEHLESLDGLRNIKLLDIQGQRCRFSFEFAGSASKAQSLIALNRHFAQQNYAGELSFSWQR
ncbi:MAG: DUF2066 domain-containing protein, partial [Gammaproteobacteria bacterium]|nr:DUF2066 domain-containing protein [Gammaproteobacteria bacterium]